MHGGTLFVFPGPCFQVPFHKERLALLYILCAQFAQLVPRNKVMEFRLGLFFALGILPHAIGRKSKRADSLALGQLFHFGRVGHNGYTAYWDKADWQRISSEEAQAWGLLVPDEWAVLVRHMFADRMRRQIGQRAQVVGNQRRMLR
jgi:hypothetical protein